MLAEAGVQLFPSCDPRGVLTRALAPGADWSTRPDALVFGWMLALAPGVDSRKAAAAVLAVTDQQPGAMWSAAQRALLMAIEDVRVGRARHPAERR